MIKKIFVTMSMILLLTITVLSCSDDSNPSEPDPVQSLTVTVPNGSEIWNVGGTRTIKWVSNFTGNVIVDLYKNEVYSQTIATVENTGEFNWKIPVEMLISEDYKIKITNSDDNTESDMSDDFFSTSVPIVYLYDTSNIITNSEYKVQWYGNSNDSSNLNYFFHLFHFEMPHESHQLIQMLQDQR